MMLGGRAADAAATKATGAVRRASVTSVVRSKERRRDSMAGMRETEAAWAWGWTDEGERSGAWSLSGFGQEGGEGEPAGGGDGAEGLSGVEFDVARAPGVALVHEAGGGAGHEKHGSCAALRVERAPEELSLIHI